MENIDRIAHFCLLCLLFSAIVFPSELMGGISLIFSSLIIFKTIFSKNKLNYQLDCYEKLIIVYFLFVTISLFGSTLFNLSLHGYIKTLIYTLFFFCASIYFKDNKDRIYPTIVFATLLMSFESIIAIMQNYTGVAEISGWQDKANINPEEIISRAYGTLLPYNPNLLAGYLLAGLSGYIYIILVNFSCNKKKRAFVFSILFLLNLVAIIDTGCRGAYLGFLLFFPVLFLTGFLYFKKQCKGFSSKYRNLIIAVIVLFLIFIITNPAILKRFESILAFRQDSSISFRMNVYESAFKMFLDNPFLGIGVGNQNFREIYGLYMKTGFDALGSYCVPLEIAVESGIFTLLSFLGFLYAVVKKCFINIFKLNLIENEKILSFSILLLIFAIFGHGLFDTIWFRPQVQFLFWTNIAMLKSLKK